MSRIKVLLIAGARPNFMKIAPLIRAIEAGDSNGGGHSIDWRLVHTGQHYDTAMSEIFFSELGIPAPHINLEVGSGTQAVQTANVMKEFEPVCLAERPDWIVVVGDVNSTVACALVATKLGIKVAHVEAGLRSFDRSMPEEINRLITDTLSDLLLTPSPDADENLKREGIAPAKIELVGNVMIDAVIANLDKARASRVMNTNDVDKQKFVYVTLHRPSNVDDPLSLTSIMLKLTRLAGEMPVVFPMHPRTRKMCAQFGVSCEDIRGLKILDPIGYHDSLSLAENARFILTDSGGLQEEATFFRTPCLTLRPNTERPITIEIGSNRLTTIESLPSDIAALMAMPSRFGQIPPLWDGRSGERIVQVLLNKNAAGSVNGNQSAKEKQPLAC